MPTCRITAAYTENPQETIVFIGTVGPDNQLAHAQLIGYVKDADGPNEEIGTYPCIIEPVGRDRAGKIMWGDWNRHHRDFADHEDINVFLKKMVVGEYLTRRSDDEEYTYRITHVVPIG